MQRIAALLAAILLPTTLSSPALAVPAQERAAIERLFNASDIDPSWFADVFLAQVSASQVQQIVDDLESRYGELRSVEAAKDGYILQLEHARLPARITLDAEDRIAGLFFQAALAAGTVKDHLAAIETLPGNISYLVATDGKPRAAHDADIPLAVGSAVKLAILEAVAEAVGAGRLAWDQVAELKPEWRSLPSGILQDWPDGTPLTVETLAGLMISQSDNTATDALVSLAGRSAVEKITPRNTPFLTTRDLFVLKAKANADLRRRWLAGDEETRRALLDEIAKRPLPRVSDLESAPTHEVEWFLSARELCALMEKTAHLPALAISAGPIPDENWKAAAYKGGSETGVLNLSARVVASDGTTHCIAATWNADHALDAEKLVSPWRGALQALAGE